MSKATIVKFFIGSVAAGIVGAILVVTTWGVFPADVFVKNGADIVGVQGSTFAWAVFGLGVAGVIVLVGAAFAAVAGWIGALLNTSTLERKTWFIALALLGVFDLGLLALFAYVVAGPDGPRRTTTASTLTTAGAS